jgi:putative transposase
MLTTASDKSETLILLVCSPKSSPYGMRVYSLASRQKDFQMSKKRKRHNPEQIVAKLRDADVMLNSGKDLALVLQSLEICEATYHRWRNQFGGMKSEEAKRLKELDLENARLKRLLAEAELDKAILKEALRGNG